MHAWTHTACPPVRTWPASFRLASANLTTRGTSELPSLVLPLCASMACSACAHFWNCTNAQPARTTGQRISTGAAAGSPCNIPVLTHRAAQVSRLLAFGAQQPCAVAPPLPPVPLGAMTSLYTSFAGSRGGLRPRGLKACCPKVCHSCEKQWWAPGGPPALWPLCVRRMLMCSMSP